MLKVSELIAEIENTKVLDGLYLEVGEGQIHVLLGPNGSGKSSLSKVIMGVGGYEVTSGSIEFEGKDITNISPDERARMGIFLANQYPIEVPGVGLANFLRLAYNSRFSDDKNKLSVTKFKKLLQEKAKLVDLDEKFLDRNLNEGFSGGEKKKSEILQMAVLEPKLAILDETDSGLDVDALKQVFKAVSKIKKENKDMTLLVITHYERVFEYITPDKVHVMKDGKIIETGGKELADKIQKHGFKK
ncbi:Fe-S cluster assembly ATPase SufC [Candidatus Dojkabacteria bacterium]|nr:Fe-S cluster assembly ATPase SufC [Candidatus Dojkabacteria bacterium]